MAVIRGCELPEDLFYWIERHVWVRPPEVEGGTARLGITPSGFKLAGGKVVALTPRHKSIGQSIAMGKPVAMLESNKYVGAIPAPFAGVLVSVNEAVVADPGLATRDPYGKGWIAEMRPNGWEVASSELATGQAAVEGYRALLEEENISCE